ncbi:MAG: NAD(P)-dependent oxidoreductase, partial [Rhodoglobus sp.]|nr:NAD(P)-dependent oxidoreductase [Rhodoglobus sp.]
MTEIVRPEARALVVSSLRAGDRVLVTGSAGWFGITVAALLHGTPHPVMFLTQNARRVPYPAGEFDAVAWDHDAVRDFAPTVVIDCAFILRDYIAAMPLDEYFHANTVLTSRLLQLTMLDSVRAIVSVSSGAAVHPVDAASVDADLNPYGYLKRQTELAVTRLGDETATHVVVARPWSLSGTLVTRPHRYAFSDLILRSRTDSIEIQATHEVWRRYVGVDDFFAVSLATATAGNAVINSGGELVEFSDLAKIISATLGSAAPITRPALSGDPADDYYTR